MARNHGRILTTIWSDPDFRSLDQKTQRLYLFLISQPNLSHAGLLPLTLRRWASAAGDLPASELQDHLDVLDKNRYIVIDHDTEELLIRSFVRNDGVWKQPKVMLSMAAGAEEMVSVRLRYALVRELERLPLHELADSVRKAVEPCVASLRERLLGPDADGPEGVSDTHPDTPGDGFGVGIDPDSVDNPVDNRETAGPKGTGKGIGKGSAEGTGYPHAGARAPSPTPSAFPVPLPEPLPPSAADESARPEWVSAADGNSPAVTTQTLIAEYIDGCQQRPPGQVIGQLSKLIKQMLDEGIKPDRIRDGLTLWKAKGLNPSTLPSVVNEVMNGSGGAHVPSPRGHQTYRNPAPSVYYNPKAGPR